MSEREINITAGEIAVFASLNDTATASLVWKALPIQASANLWGDEIYFGIPVPPDEEPRQEVVDLGDLAYWPRLLHVLWSHPCQSGRRNPPGQPGYRHRPDERRTGDAEVRPCRSTGPDRASLKLTREPRPAGLLPRWPHHAETTLEDRFEELGRRTPILRLECPDHALWTVQLAQDALQVLKLPRTGAKH